MYNHVFLPDTCAAVAPLRPERAIEAAVPRGIHRLQPRTSNACHRSGHGAFRCLRAAGDLLAIHLDHGSRGVGPARDAELEQKLGIGVRGDSQRRADNRIGAIQICAGEGVRCGGGGGINCGHAPGGRGMCSQTAAEITLKLGKLFCPKSQWQRAFLPSPLTPTHLLAGRRGSPAGSTEPRC